MVLRFLKKGDISSSQIEEVNEDVQKGVPAQAGAEIFENNDLQIQV